MRNHWLTLTATIGVAGFTSTAIAADHADGPAASMDPAADITDVYSWVSADGAKTYLVMDVFPFAVASADAAASAKFSNAVQYVFHTVSQAAYGAATSTALNVICTFDAAQTISCWAGSEYLHGNASAVAGLSSASAKMRVFAGLRDDPFFFNLAGFAAAEATVIGAKSGLTFDAAGCPILDGPTSALLVRELSTNPATDGGPAQDFVGGANVLSIVIELDTTVLTAGGPIMSVWASTNRAQ
ncbi:MAG TPA: DUF4331 family protein [Polyangiaceae bacterium]